MLAIRAVERHLEIVGEAVNHLRKPDPSIPITGAEKIISLRNLIAHAYDSVDVAILWGIIQKDIPILSEEIQRIKS